VSPEWLERLCERNGQLLSRLRGIETKVDASWQVLIDYLRNTGPFEFPIALYATVSPGAENVHVLFGASEAPQNMLGSSDVPISHISGLFGCFLTKQQADDRVTARRRPTAVGLGESGYLAALFGSQPQEPVREPLAPLDPGSITVPTTTVWLALTLPKVTPHHLFLSATLTELRVEFSGGAEMLGTISGGLEGPTARGGGPPERADISGTASLASEWHLPADATKVPPEPERTHRSCDLLVKLSVHDRP
jgi:hypothetical protein